MALTKAYDGKGLAPRRQGCGSQRDESLSAKRPASSNRAGRCRRRRAARRRCRCRSPGSRRPGSSSVPDSAPCRSARYRTVLAGEGGVGATGNGRRWARSLGHGTLGRAGCAALALPSGFGDRRRWRWAALACRWLRPRSNFNLPASGAAVSRRLPRGSALSPAACAHLPMACRSTLPPSCRRSGRTALTIASGGLVMDAL